MMEYIRTATREFTAGAAPALRVENRSGSTTVEGQDTDRITVQAVARIWADSAEAADHVFEQILAGIRPQGDTLTVITPEFPESGGWFRFGRGTNVDYAITAPHRTTARIDSRSGRVEVARIAGPLAVESRSGRVAVRAVTSDVALVSRSGAVEVADVGGGLTVDARSGRVSARAVQGDARIVSRSGTVQVERVGGNLAVQSHSGAVHIQGVGGRVEALVLSGRVSVSEVGAGAQVEAKSGVISLTAVRGPARARTASGDIIFRGAVLGDLDLHAASGSVRLEVDLAHPFRIDAETAAGSIHSDLSPRRDDTPPPAGAPTVRVRTASGSIRIGRSTGF
jgi:hypothetical protein